MKTVVVTGTDTEVGKTYVSCLLIRKLRETGLKVGAWKPVCSGAIRDDSGELRWEDVDALADAVDRDVASEVICPQRFEAAVAPNIAAKMEGRTVDEGLIRRGPTDWEGESTVVIIEGAGGLLSPISASLTTADVAQQNNSSVVIVSANRLGVINHTLLTVEAVRSRGLKIASVVLTDMTAVNDESAQTNFDQLRHLLSDLTILRVANQSSELTGDSDAIDAFLRGFRDISQ